VHQAKILDVFEEQRQRRSFDVDVFVLRDELVELLRELGPGTPDAAAAAFRPHIRSAP
jgi:hypothetical protein